MSVHCVIRCLFGIINNKTMPSCTAVYCSNRSEKGFRLFKFPSDVNRKVIWVHNMKRANWAPTKHSYLCEIHFQESQFEKNRADGWQKLKPNAIPTIFDIPIPPERRSIKHLKKNMPGCSAPKCSNSSVKRFKMCSFPLKDVIRCAIWVQNMQRPNWTPTKHSVLCQVHFAPEMWEQHRKDGLLKLKCRAVPTLFEDPISKKHFVFLLKAFMMDMFIDTSNPPNKKPNLPVEFVSLMKVDPICEEKQKDDVSIIENEISDASNFCETSISDVEDCRESPLEHDPIDHAECDKRILNLTQRLFKSKNLRRQLTIKLSTARQKIKRLEKHIQTFNQRPEVMNRLFNEDQQKALSGLYKKMPLWSNSTIEKAIKYKSNYGTKGYADIASDLGLPCLRTLNRRLQNSKLKGNNIDQV